MGINLTTNFSNYTNGCLFSMNYKGRKALITLMAVVFLEREGHGFNTDSCRCILNFAIASLGDDANLVAMSATLNFQLSTLVRRRLRVIHQAKR